MKPIHILWVLSIVVAFLGGWAIRQKEYVNQPPSILVSQNAKKTAYIQDKMSLSQSQATAATANSGRVDALTDADIVTIERLVKLPSYILRKAYDQKMEWVEKRSIDKKFWRPDSEQDRKQHREYLFHSLQDSLQESKYWLGKISLKVSGKTMPLTLILNFYDSTNITEKTSEPQPIVNPNDLCWHLATYFSNEPSDKWAGSSSCLESVMKNNGRYFIVQMLNIDGIEPHFSHLAVEIPFASARGQNFELLETKSGNWHGRDGFHWTPISKEEARSIEKELRQTSE